MRVQSFLREIDAAYSIQINTILQRVEFPNFSPSATRMPLFVKEWRQRCAQAHAGTNVLYTMVCIENLFQFQCRL